MSEKRDEAPIIKVYLDFEVSTSTLVDVTKRKENIVKLVEDAVGAKFHPTSNECS